MATDTFTLETISLETVYFSISLSSCQNISSSSLISALQQHPKTLSPSRATLSNTCWDNSCSQELMCRENNSPNIASDTQKKSGFNLSSLDFKNLLDLLVCK